MKFMCIRNELQPTYAVRDCCRVLVVVIIVYVASWWLGKSLSLAS